MSHMNTDKYNAKMYEHSKFIELGKQQQKKQTLEEQYNKNVKLIMDYGKYMTDSYHSYPGTTDDTFDKSYFQESQVIDFPKRFTKSSSLNIAMVYNMMLCLLNDEKKKTEQLQDSYDMYSSMCETYEDEVEDLEKQNHELKRQNMYLKFYKIMFMICLLYICVVNFYTILHIFTTIIVAVYNASTKIIIHSSNYIDNDNIYMKLLSLSSFIAFVYVLSAMSKK